MKPDFLGPVRQSTLADQVTDNVRDAIISGALTPGERLAEPELAERMHLSRSPVREALRRLEREGLVWRETNRSCYVWEPTEADVDEIISMRVALESLAAERIFDRLEENDLVQLDNAIATQQSLIRDGKFMDLIHEDYYFHEFLCRRAEHSRLMIQFRQIMAQWMVLTHRRMQSNPAQIVPTVITDHQALVSALRIQDLDHVVRLHREINERFKQETIDALRANWPVR